MKLTHFKDVAVKDNVCSFYNLQSFKPVRAQESIFVPGVEKIESL